MTESVDATETAWRIHAALSDWTGKVDAKATFALTIQAASAVGIITLAAPGRLFGQLAGASLWCFRVGGVLLGLGLISALLVAIPRLRSKRLSDEQSRNWIYFGHLRHWDEDDLVAALRSRDPLPVISRQLIAMSQIAWVKHRRVQVAFSAISGSGLAYLLAALLR